MKQTLYTILCVLFFNAFLSAQSYDVTNLRVTEFSHNFECGSDGFFSDPEPNFRVNWRVVGGTFGALAVVNPGASTLACGSYTTNVPLTPSSYSGTESSLQFYVESWEEDGCGDADTYDTGFFCNDDANYDDTDLTVSLTGNPVALILSNGSTVTIEYDLVVLPVELAYFEGEYMDNTVQLDWATEMEKNSFEFEVQRSSNGRDFNTIGIIDAAGESDKEIDYSYMDQEPLPHAYYRLKIVDLDGYTEYSEVLTIRGENAPLVIEKIYPNPTNGQLNVQVHLPRSQELDIIITDIMGREMMRESFYGEEGQFEHPLNVGNLPQGQYFISIFDGEKILTERFFKGGMKP